VIPCANTDRRTDAEMIASSQFTSQSSTVDVSAHRPHRMIAPHLREAMVGKGETTHQGPPVITAWADYI
jgi:hypothetical protein